MSLIPTDIFTVVPAIITQGDTGTPSVIEFTAYRTRAGVRAPYSGGKLALRVQVCNAGLWADSTNATIAAQTGYATIIETHQATKDISFHSPVGAAATATLTISGVVINGETVLINGRVYEFTTDGTIVAGSDVACDISAGGTQSEGTLGMATKPTATDTVTIGTRTYTFVAAATLDGEVTIGAAVANSQANLVAAVAGTDGINTAHPQVTMADFAADAAVVTAIAPGVAGDSIITTETFTDGTDAFDAATLGTTTAGVDVTATQAGDALVAALAADSSAICTGSNSTGTVTLTANTLTDPPLGNAYTSTETMANGAFGGATFAGGTISDGSKLRVAVTNGTAESITVRCGAGQLGGIPADYGDAALTLTHAAP